VTPLDIRTLNMNTNAIVTVSPLTPGEIKKIINYETKNVTIHNVKFAVYIHPPKKRTAIRTVKIKQKTIDPVTKREKSIVVGEEHEEYTWTADNYIELIPVDAPNIHSVAYSDMSTHCDTYLGEPIAYKSAVHAAKQIASYLKMQTDYRY